MSPRGRRPKWVPMWCRACGGDLWHSWSPAGDSYFYCRACERRWETMEEAMATHRLEKTSLGQCWVVKTLEVVDEVPELLASGLPVWLEEEWSALKTMSAPSERQRLWDRRAKAVTDELAFRAHRPGWTVYGPAGKADATKTPPATPTPTTDPTGGFLGAEYVRKHEKNRATAALAARLEAARAARVARKEAGHALKHSTPVEKLANDPGSKAKAIAAKCWDCQGGDADPCVGWRIGNCGVVKCPLWGVRPHQRLHGRPVPPSLRCGDDAKAS